MTPEQLTAAWLLLVAFSLVIGAFIGHILARPPDYEVVHAQAAAETRRVLEELDRRLHPIGRASGADERIALAIALAVKHGGHGETHHKAWVIDQMVRALAGDRYEELVRAACAGADGPDTYSWEVGIAP